MADRNIPSFLAGVITGALAGAGLALLLAPSSGDETRDVLRTRAREAADRAREAADRARETAERARAAASEAASGAASGATDVYERSVGMVSDVRRTIDEAVHEGRAAAAEQRAALDALLPDPQHPE
jgi:gas vesicle protein